MSDFVILTDSSCDLPADLAREKGIEYVPLTVRLDGKEYRNELDESEISSKDFYDKLRNGAPVQTSAPTVQEFEERIAAFAEKGQDVLYLGFSSALSATYNVGRSAIEAVREKYPERKLLAVDTLCASLGEGLLVLLAEQQRAKGKSIDEVAKYVEDTKLHLCHWFTVADLEHLRRGGRISGASAMLGTLLQIRPLMHVNDLGELKVVSKVRGQRAVLQRIVERVQQTAIEPQNQLMCISHGDCEDEAKLLRDMVAQSLGVKEFVISPVGPVIGAHSGPGTLAFFFLGNER
ncbi:MAG TPA: DegV family protein [Candidatus Aphodomonas merdavium]|nr:DegV family protein [Candidatus Aphodomonas merdavium]